VIGESEAKLYDSRYQVKVRIIPRALRPAADELKLWMMKHLASGPKEPGTVADMFGNDTDHGSATSNCDGTWCTRSG
jgi:hypothetical protein